MQRQQSHTWIEQFCAQLLRSRPELPIRFAIKRAIATFPYAADLHPFEAARLLAAALPARIQSTLKPGRPS